MRKMVFLLIAILISIPAFAAAGGTVSSEGAQKIKAEEALEILKQAYSGRSSERFFSMVSQEPYFKIVDLKFDLTKHFDTFSQIDWNVVNDNVVIENNKVAIKTHWQKRMVRNQTGNVETSEGSTEFIFIVSEEAKLLDFRGDNPF